MSRNLVFRRAGVLAATATAGVLVMGGPAVADVTVSPTSAAQGSGANLRLTVTNTGQSPITEVKLVLPADTPVAEVFPLSVDDWAPQIATRTLDTPLTSIHGGSPVHETAAAITWIAVPGKSIAPGGSAGLTVALGPLPATGTMSFTVEPTYAGGSGPAMPPAVLTLTPAAPGGESAGHSSHGGTTAESSSSGDAAFVIGQADQGPGLWSMAGWIVAALAVAGAVLVMLRNRHRLEPDDDEPDDDEPDGGEPDEDAEPVGAGVKVTAWSYRDGPVAGGAVRP